MPSSPSSGSITENEADTKKSKSAVSVLLIAPGFNILGGQAVQANHLRKIIGALPDIRFSFCPIGPPPPKFLSWVMKVRGLRTLVSFLQYLPRLAFAVPRHKVIHIFSAGLNSYVIWTMPALILGKLFRKRIILHYHDGQVRQHLAWPTTRATFAWADCIITPSGFLLDVFTEEKIPARTISNILDADNFTYRARRKLRPVFMTNRILEPLYNVECILRAFKIVQNKYPEATLTIAHDGPSKPGLEKYAVELGLANTRFIGRVPPDKIRDLYNAADIYLTTPNFDCMPGSILECYASGLPLVATNAGGIPYIATDRKTALLIDVNDHEAVAARAFELLDNPDLVERLTANGLAEVQRYYWRPVRDQWAALYREMAELG